MKIIMNLITALILNQSLYAGDTPPNPEQAWTESQFNTFIHRCITAVNNQTTANEVTVGGTLMCVGVPHATMLLISALSTPDYKSKKPFLEGCVKHAIYGAFCTKDQSVKSLTKEKFDAKIQDIEKVINAKLTTYDQTLTTSFESAQKKYSASVIRKFLKFKENKCPDSAREIIKSISEPAPLYEKIQKYKEAFMIKMSDNEADGKLTTRKRHILNEGADTGEKRCDGGTRCACSNGAKKGYYTATDLAAFNLPAYSQGN